MGHGAEAVGRLDDGKVVLTAGVAPGDRCEVAIVTEHARYVEAIVAAVIEAGPDRREAPCRHARSGECGGCAWQHLTEAAQRREKESLVRREVGRIAPEAIVRPIASGTQAFGYRRRAKLGHRGPVLGYRARQTRRVFDVLECPVLDPRLEAALPEIRAAVTGRPDGNLDVLVDADGTVHVDGPATVFAQPNAETEATLVALVLEAVPRTARAVVELFAGAGTFTLPLASRGHALVTYEVDRQAVRRLEELALDVDARRADLLRAGAALDFGHPDALLLDPPRDGAAPCLDAIAASRASVVVYVSCEPMTLCRDLRGLRDRGYRVEWVAPVDAFPQTPHVECVARLSR